MSMMNDAVPAGKKMWKVIAPNKSKDGQKTYWTKIGVAFTNKDGSINVHMDFAPLKNQGQIQLRDHDEPDYRTRFGLDGAGAEGGSAASHVFGATAAADAITKHTSTSGDVPF